MGDYMGITAEPGAVELHKEWQEDVERIAPANAGAAKPQRAEYVERLCRQFDFGTPIASRFVIALRGWKHIFDRFPILDSPAYHAIRAYFRWERFTPRYKNTGWKSKWELQDFREGRPPERAM